MRTGPPGTPRDDPDPVAQLTELVVERCRRVAFGALSERAAVTAKHSFLDWFGAALAGSREPLAGMLVAATSGSGSACRLVGRPERAGELAAALVNGAASHALDYDDMHFVMDGHPSVAILPALLAACERGGATGEEVMAAFAAGVEAGCLVGAAVQGAHGLGWHTTGVVGVLGAAAACSHLLGADDLAWRRALGLAATQAAGLRVMFGTMGKPLHAGKAAADGLLAARLAGEGFTASLRVLEEPRGFVDLFGGDLRRVSSQPGGPLAVEGMLFKYHAACFGTQATLANAHALRRGHGLAAADVELVELRVSPELDGVCNLPVASTGLEAKFSLRTTAALGLLGYDTADPATFSDPVVRDPALATLRDRVRVVFEPSALGRPTWGALRLVTTSGQELRAETDTGIPEEDLAAREERLARKFRVLAGTVLPPVEVAALERELLGLETLADVRALLARCSAG